MEWHPLVYHLHQRNAVQIFMDLAGHWEGDIRRSNEPAGMKTGGQWFLAE